MNFTKYGCVPTLLLGAFLAGSAHATTSYDMAFTDTTPGRTFSNAVGTFSINSADQITSFNVSFTVSKAYSFEDAHGSPGDVITFDTADLRSTPITYNPVTGFFGSGYNYSFAPTENQSSNPNNGAFVGIQGGYGVLGDVYSIDALSQNEFSSGPIDGGTWAVTLAPIKSGAAPEPTSLTVFSIGLLVLALSIRRSRKALLSR